MAFIKKGHSARKGKHIAGGPSTKGPTALPKKNPGFTKAPMASTVKNPRPFTPTSKTGTMLYSMNFPSAKGD